MILKTVDDFRKQVCRSISTVLTSLKHCAVYHFTVYHSCSLPPFSIVGRHEINLILQRNKYNITPATRKPGTRDATPRHDSTLSRGTNSSFCLDDLNLRYNISKLFTLNKK